MARTKRKRRRRMMNVMTWAKGALKGMAVKPETMAKWSEAKIDKLFQQGMIKPVGRGAQTIKAVGLGRTTRAAAKLAARGGIKKKAKKKRATKKRATKKKTKKRATKKRATKKKTKKRATKKRARKKTTSRRPKKARRKTTRKKMAKKRGRKKAGRRRGTRARRLAGRGWVRDTKRLPKGRRGAGARKVIGIRRGYRMPTGRRKKLVRAGWLGAGGKVNPGRRRRRRRRSRRRNPGGMFGQAKAFGTMILKAGGGAGAAYLLHGVSAYVIDKGIGMIPSVNPTVQKVARVAGSGAATALTVFLARKVESMGAGKFVGRAISTGALVLGSLMTLKTVAQEFMPGGWLDQNLPDLAPRGLPFMGGMSDWVELRGMRGLGSSGVGDFATPEQLVAGESFAHSINQFKGMGDYRIPATSIRGMGALPMGMSYPGQYGMGGMGDWFETLEPGGALDPGAETF